MAAASVASRLGRVDPTRAVFFLCDVQERFRDVILEMPSLIESSKLLLGAANVLSIPIVVTEQYPKAMKHTCAELLPAIDGTDGTAACVVEKTAFSMLVPGVDAVLAETCRTGSAVLFGIEAHICVQQTCLDLLARGTFESVTIVEDATSSQRATDRTIALERMRRAGATITSTESLIFEMVGGAKHPHFKAVSALVKARQFPE
jgi:nicotinamidase-related amidase